MQDLLRQEGQKGLVEPGEFVHVYIPRRRVRRSPKWQRYYTGPYRVMKKLTDLTEIVKETPRSNPKVVHVDKMRKWVGEVSPKWAQANAGDESTDEPRVYRPDPVLEDTGMDRDLEDLPPKGPRHRPEFLKDSVESLS